MSNLLAYLRIGLIGFYSILAIDAYLNHCYVICGLCLILITFMPWQRREK